MDFSLLLAYMFSVILLIITPGPVVALVISTSLVSGPKRAMLTALGTNWASIVLIMMAALILTGTLSLSMTVLSWISLAGCFFIAYLSVQALTRLLAHAPECAGEVGHPGKQRNGLLTGFMVGISNPKDILFFVSFFPQFIRVTPSFQGSITILAALWVVIDLSILFAYIFLMRQKSAMKYKRPVEFASSIMLLAISTGGIFYSGKALFVQ